MMMETLQLGALLTAATGILVGLLKKIPGWPGSLNPRAAVLIGAALALVADGFGLFTPDPTMVEAVTMGAGFGLAAVGGHNVGKRLGTKKDE